MAITKNQISYGSKGDEVKELQTALNSAGYSLDVDGSFGSKTQAAVKDYQKKNGLQVDGIVGKNTWGSLLGSSTSGTTTTPAATTTNSSTTTTKSAAQTALESVPKFEYGEYQESDLVAQAKAALQAQLNNKPDAYQSTYQQQINDVLNKILNREKFSYDLNGDALYQQYKDQYTTQGKQAMMDTMGQAAALTGGYGNSYAQSVGQQTYQGYLQQLNDKVPELYQLALNKYDMEGDDLLNQYSLYTDRENDEYGKYRDSLNDYYTNLDYLTNQYQDERNFDYGKYTDNMNMGYQTYKDQLSNAMWQTEFETSNEQWQKEFDEAMRQFNIANGLNADGTAKTATSSSSSSKTSDKKGDTPEKTTNYTNQQKTDATAKTGSIASFDPVKAKSFTNNDDLWDYLLGLVNKGSLTYDEAKKKYSQYAITKNLNTSGSTYAYGTGATGGYNNKTATDYYWK